MFQPPKPASAFVPPPTTINTEERFLFKCVKLTDQGLSQFADPAKGETFHQIDWTFHVAHGDSKAQIFSADGTPWEYVERTTSKTGKNPKNGMVAKARLFIEALLGHGLEDDEITADLPSKLVGKYAVGFFEYVERQAQDTTTYNKLQIMRLSPYRGDAAPAPAPAPPPPVQQPEPAQAGIPF